MGCLARCTGQTDGLTTGKDSSDVVSSSVTTSQLKVRFQSLLDTDALSRCVKANIIMEKIVDELLQLSKVLVKEYADDISDELFD